MERYHLVVNCVLRVHTFALVYQARKSHGDVIKWKHFPRYWRIMRGIPLTKVSDAEHWCFLWSVPKQTVEQTMAVRHRAHYDITEMIWDETNNKYHHIYCTRHKTLGCNHMQFSMPDPNRITIISTPEFLPTKHGSLESMRCAVVLMNSKYRLPFLIYSVISSHTLWWM